MRPLVWVLLLTCTFSAAAQQSEEERRKQWLDRVLKAQSAAPAPPVRDGGASRPTTWR